MKILWVKSDFLHPTTRGGQIRTLEILKHLHRWHEVHFAGLTSHVDDEGPQRAPEYSTRSYAIPHPVTDKRSIGFAMDLVQGSLSRLPVVLKRFRSAKMLRFLQDLERRKQFDRIVCDFLSSAPNIPNLSRTVLFQHNVETMIWRRRAEHTKSRLAKAYLRLQADRMFRYERDTCRRAGSIVAVSPDDEKAMRQMFGVAVVHVIPTGVNVDYFAPREASPPIADLVFCGSMDWPANVDGIEFFLRKVWPVILRARPGTTFAVVGRYPSQQLRIEAEKAPGLLVTGTVPDVRPYLWGAKVSVVPLRIGGGTRLKIYESMAARVPVVSTTVGAEGLATSHPENIRLADSAEGFARQCLDLLESEDCRAAMAEAGWRLVATRFTSEQVARKFEEIVLAGPDAAEGGNCVVP